MSTTPQNQYYLRSLDQHSSWETTPDPLEETSDTSLELSDIDTNNPGGSSTETKNQNIVNTTIDMASGFHILMPPFHGNSGENAKDWI